MESWIILSKEGGLFDISERVPELGFGFSGMNLYDMRATHGSAWRDEGKGKSMALVFRELQELASGARHSVYANP